MKNALLVAVVAGLGLAMTAGASPVLVSSTAPTVGAYDIANLAWTDNQTDKFWTDTAAHGQAFTTGSSAGGYQLISFSTQVNTTRESPQAMTYRLRLVTIAGDNTTTTTVRQEETHVLNSEWDVGDWITWTFDTPVDLNPDTLYGVDVDHMSGGAWQQGIPYIRFNRTNDVPGAFRYTRARGDDVTTISAATGHDRVFHLEIIPEPGTVGLLGLFGVALVVRRRIRK